MILQKLFEGWGDNIIFSNCDCVTEGAKSQNREYPRIRDITNSWFDIQNKKKRWMGTSDKLFISKIIRL